MNLYYLLVTVLSHEFIRGEMFFYIRVVDVCLLFIIATHLTDVHNICVQFCLQAWEYELFSIMVHSGNATGGHYYAYIKWVVWFSDKNVICFSFVIFHTLFLKPHSRIVSCVSMNYLPYKRTWYWNNCALISEILSNCVNILIYIYRHKHCVIFLLSLVYVNDFICRSFDDQQWYSFNDQLVTKVILVLFNVPVK